jgi:uroporphyrinogen-III synthase
LIVIDPERDQGHASDMARVARRKIWITRARPGADITAERVWALGHEAFVAPLLVVRAIPEAQVDLTGVAALAFTSANGVRAFAEKSPERHLRVFAVGAATAQTAKALGFRTVLSADGDVAALAEGIALRSGEFRGIVLHPSASEAAGDLTGVLARRGVEVRPLTLYETVPVTLTAEQLAMLPRLDAVLLHSPKAARTLARVLRTNPAPQLRALGLSKAVIAPLGRARLAEKLFAPFPLEAGLLNLIDRKP